MTPEHAALAQSAITILIAIAILAAIATVLALVADAAMSVRRSAADQPDLPDDTHDPTASLSEPHHPNGATHHDRT